MALSEEDVSKEIVHNSLGLNNLINLHEHVDKLVQKYERRMYDNAN